jgi:hypothetical protein
MSREHKRYHFIFRHGMHGDKMMARLMDSDKREQSRVVIWGASFAGLLMLAGLCTAGYVGISRHLNPQAEATVTTGIGTGKPAQRDAESALAKSDPAGLEDSTGGRARNMKMTSRDLQLSDQQRQRLRTVTTAAGGPKLDAAGFELMIGTAIPEKTPLADLPPEVSEIMNGYWGDQYLMVQDNMIVVDQHTRRVAAIVSM